MQRKSVVGTRSSLLWLLILVVVVVLIGAIVVALVVLPQLQASRAEQARLAEVERHYQAGFAFQGVDDWTSAEGEYKQVIALDAGYKDVTERLASVRTRQKESVATVTAVAVAQAERVQADASATVQAAPMATQQALEASYQKGLAYMNLGRWSEAQSELERVLDANPNYKEVQAKLAQIAAESAKKAPTSIPTAKPSPPTNTPTSRPRTIEIAGGKPATASGYYNGPGNAFPPENVTDRKTDESMDCAPGRHTYWLLPDHTTGWVQVDLQQSYAITKLRWLNAHNGTCGDRATTRVRIALSTTGNFQGEEQIIYSGSMPFSRTPDFQEVSLPTPIEARFVRLYVDDYYNWGGGLNEVEIYAQVPS